MPDSPILDTLKVYVRENLAPRSGAEDISESQSLIESGIIDSLGIARLLTFIETRFRIRIPEADLYPENFESLTAIERLITRIR